MKHRAPSRVEDAPYRLLSGPVLFSEIGDGEQAGIAAPIVAASGSHTLGWLLGSQPSGNIGSRLHITDSGVDWMAMVIGLKRLRPLLRDVGGGFSRVGRWFLCFPAGRCRALHFPDPFLR